MKIKDVTGVIILSSIGVIFLLYAQFDLPYRSTVFLTGGVYVATSLWVLFDVKTKLSPFVHKFKTAVRNTLKASIEYALPILIVLLAHLFKFLFSTLTLFTILLKQLSIILASYGKKWIHAADRSVRVFWPIFHQNIAHLIENFHRWRLSLPKRSRQPVQLALNITETEVKGLWSRVFSGPGLALLAASVLLMTAFYTLAILRFINAHDGISMFFIWQGLD
jgi:hypothetical protein